jgi:hypothetical protein
MVVISFKKEFADNVRNGSKCRTTRIDKSDRYKPGILLHLYSGLRQRYKTELLRVGKLTDTWLVDIDTYLCTIMVHIHYTEYEKQIIEQFMPFTMLQLHARLEGFIDSEEMFDWFRNRYGNVKLYNVKILEWSVDK